MASAFGGPWVREPSWRKYLRFETTPPFKLEWIVITEAGYPITGRLKNRFNEDLPVYVGFDGQEIEPRAGVELCRLIDRFAERRHRR